jgi:thiol-disulfide isomerase/thioredoxin
MLKTVISLAGLVLASGAFAAAQDSVPAAKLVPAAEKPAPAQDAPAPEPMTIGSPAPKPDIELFVRGEEPKWFDGDKTYVVEFWATWCGPCRASMPHISDLADKYMDKVVVVGVSDEKEEVVRKFLDTDEWKQKARYNLCTDPDRSTHRQYMEAAGQNGIPTAFVVKGGTVQWIGHPMGMDEPLEKIVGGSWDAAGYKAEFEAEATAARKQMQRRREIAKARKDGNWDAIVKMIDEDIAAAPEGQQAGLKMQKFMMLLTDAKMPEKGYAVGREIFGSSKDDAMTLNQLAWFVLDDRRVEQRDIPFALEVAKQAVTASKGEDAAIMDTLARAWWESGDKAKAVEWQKKAVEQAEGDAADELRSTLEKYQSGEAPTPTKKTSLRLDDAPAAKPGDAPAAKPGDAPAATPGDAPTAPRAPRAPRPAAKLSPSAEKVFPELEAQGFDSTDDLLAFVPKANSDYESLMRIVRAMRSSTDDGKVSLRIAAAMISDMRPMAEAQVKQFGKAGSMPMALPGGGADGTAFEIKPESDTEALLVAKDGTGQMIGQPRPLVKADGKWWFDFEKGSGMRPGEGAQTVMMANMMGQDMRTAMSTAAKDTAKRVLDGEFKSTEEANSAFAQAMQMQMMELMGGGMGGPGGPGGPGGRMGGPRGPGGPGGAPAGGTPPAPPAPPAGDAPKQP